MNMPLFFFIWGVSGAFIEFALVAFFAMIGTSVVYPLVLGIVFVIMALVAYPLVKKEL